VRSEPPTKVAALAADLAAMELPMTELLAAAVARGLAAGLTWRENVQLIDELEQLLQTGIHRFPYR